MDAALSCEAAPVKLPPSNAKPATLSLNSADADNADTTGNITLKYRTGDGAINACTISGGISRNQTKTCTPTDAGSTIAGQESLYVATESNDGLLVDSS